MTTDELLTAIQSWVTDRLPGRTGRLAIVRLDDGTEVPLPLVVAPRPPVPEGAIDEAELSGLERDILRVLREADKPLKKTTVAAKLSRPCSGYFRSLFGHLATLSLVEATEDFRYCAAGRCPVAEGTEAGNEPLQAPR